MTAATPLMVKGLVRRRQKQLPGCGQSQPQQRLHGCSWVQQQLQREAPTSASASLAAVTAAAVAAAAAAAVMAAALLKSGVLEHRLHSTVAIALATGCGGSSAAPVAALAAARAAVRAARMTAVIMRAAAVATGSLLLLLVVVLLRVLRAPNSRASP